MVDVQKLICPTCDAFLGIRRSFTLPDLGSDHPECCREFIDEVALEVREEYADRVWTGKSPPGVMDGVSGGGVRSTWGKGSHDDDHGPWGENAVRHLEDSR